MTQEDFSENVTQGDSSFSRLMELKLVITSNVQEKITTVNQIVKRDSSIRYRGQ